MPNRLLELYDKKINCRLGGIAAIFFWQYTFTVTVFTILLVYSYHVTTFYSQIWEEEFVRLAKEDIPHFIFSKKFNKTSVTVTTLTVGRYKKAEKNWRLLLLTVFQKSIFCKMKLFTLSIFVHCCKVRD